MRRTFVLRLHSETDIAQGRFVGRVEEVDTGRESRFESLEKFLQFVAQCLQGNGDADAGRANRGET
jgi:hypothetical protein